MGGDPYRMSDNVSTGTSNSFISDSSTVSGSIFIDFGRYGGRINTSDNLHLNNSSVEFYNASKLSDLELDVHGRNYWQASGSSGVWAAILFTDRPTVESIMVKAVPTKLSAMIKNYKVYGVNRDPRLHYDEKVLLKEGQFLNIAGEQMIYLSNTSSYFYYLLEAVDSYGENVALQEWAFYKKASQAGKKAISQLRLLPVVNGVDEFYFPKQIKLLGSNDLINWTTLLDTIDTPTPFYDYAYGRWQRFSFVNFNSYYIYKLVCYDNWRAGEDIIKIAEWEMVERTEELNTYRILAGNTNNFNSVWASPTASFDSGYYYMTNDVFNTVLINELIEYSTVSGTVSDINVKGS
jgi:hypothetical protein